VSAAHEVSKIGWNMLGSRNAVVHRRADPDHAGGRRVPESGALEIRGFDGLG
jgi:hypothetical protein